jgi:hypothetical protein
MQAIAADTTAPTESTQTRMMTRLTALPEFPRHQILRKTASLRFDSFLAQRLSFTLESLIRVALRRSGFGLRRRSSDMIPKRLTNVRASAERRCLA